MPTGFNHSLTKLLVKINEMSDFPVTDFIGFRGDF